jgi:hypothetical protein
MIETSTLSAIDRESVLEFANAMRDLDTITLLAKPTTHLSKSAKRKLWDSVKKKMEKPATDSFQALKQLRNSPNPELRQLAAQSVDKNSGAMDELRRLGKRIKQD